MLSTYRVTSLFVCVGKHKFRSNDCNLMIVDTLIKNARKKVVVKNNHNNLFVNSTFSTFTWLALLSRLMKNHIKSSECNYCLNSLSVCSMYCPFWNVLIVLTCFLLLPDENHWGTNSQFLWIKSSVLKFYVHL